MAGKVDEGDDPEVRRPAVPVTHVWARGVPERGLRSGDVFRVAVCEGGPGADAPFLFQCGSF